MAMALQRLIELMPGLQTTVRPAYVTINNTILLSNNANRRFYLIQNQSTTDSIKIYTSQSTSFGQVIPPTGAKLIDCASERQLWAQNITRAAGDLTPAIVSLEEIVGYTPYELAMLTCLVSIDESLQLMSGRKK